MANKTQMDRAVRFGEAANGYDESRCSADVGNNTSYGRWYGMNCSPWCAMAVSKWYVDAGAPQPASTAKGFAFTPSGAGWYQAQQAWSPPSANPERGWVVFFYSVSAGRIAHVGLVRGPRGSDGLIPTVEGNTNGAGSAEGGSVLLKRRSPSQSLGFRIAGYGRPDLLGEQTGEWFMAEQIPEANLEQIEKAVVEALAAGAGQEALRDAVRWVLTISGSERLAIAPGFANNNTLAEWLVGHIRDLTTKIDRNLTTFLAMAEAGFNVDLEPVKEGIILAVKEAAIEALADVDVGGLSDEDANRLAEAFARKAGERLIGTPS